MFKNIVQSALNKASDYLYTKHKQNIARCLEQRGLESTCEYIEQSMSKCKPSKSATEVMDIALKSVTLGGLYMEFGVFSGKSINYIASNVTQTVHGFDSFEGLPEFWRDGFDKGTFEINGLPAVRPNVLLHKGWFDKTLPAFVQKNNDTIALLHVDCDLYSSTKTIFESLENQIVKGTVIVFDEYFNYPIWQKGEYKAFQEFILKTDLPYRYLTYNIYHEQVAVIIE